MSNREVRMENGELCHLLLTIVPAFAGMTILSLYGSNNSVNRCKPVSNRKLFEKTKPIFEWAE